MDSLKGRQWVEMTWKLNDSQAHRWSLQLVTPGNCLKLCYSIRTKNLENLNMVVKSKLDTSLPCDEVQKKRQRLFNTYPGGKKQEAGILSHTVQGFNSLSPQECNAVTFGILYSLFICFITNKILTCWKLFREVQ